MKEIGLWVLAGILLAGFVTYVTRDDATKDADTQESSAILWFTLGCIYCLAAGVRIAWLLIGAWF